VDQLAQVKPAIHWKSILKWTSTRRTKYWTFDQERFEGCFNEQR